MMIALKLIVLHTFEVFRDQSLDLKGFSCYILGGIWNYKTLNSYGFG